MSGVSPQDTKKDEDTFEVNQLLQSIRTPRDQEIKIAENVNKLAKERD